MKLVFDRPTCLKETPFHFCPGCHHGLIHRLVAEAIDHYDLRDRCVGVASVQADFVKGFFFGFPVGNPSLCAFYL